MKKFFIDNPLLKAIVCIGFFINLPNNTFSRSLSFNTSYITSGGDLQWFNNNEGMCLFFEELVMAHSYAFDQSRNADWGSKNPELLLLIDVPINLWLHMAGIGTFHEFGRFSRGKAFGDHSPTFSHAGSSSSYKDPFSYYLSFLFKRPFSMHGVTNTTEDNSLYFTTSGANNAMLLAQNIGLRIDNNEGHVTDFFPYLLGKTHTIFQTASNRPGCTIGTAIDLYKTKGFSISKGRMNSACLISLLFSASTYSYIQGLYDYMKTGKTTLEPLVFYGFKVPEINTFLLDEGLSYSISTYYAYDETLSFSFEVEFIETGKKGAVEITGGISKTFPSFYNLELTAEISHGPSAWGWAIDCTVPLGKRFFIQAHAEPMNVLGHYGQRHISTVPHDKSNVNTYMLRFGMKY